MKALGDLKTWLDIRGFTAEAESVALLAKAASEASGMTYEVRGGDSLGRIAEDFGVTVDELMSANDLKNDKIKIKQILEIPTDKTPATDDEIIAMTLLGEGGTLPGGEKIMKEVLTVLMNRRACTGESLKSHAKKRRQFSFWNGRDENITLYSDRAYGIKNKSLWSKAMDIVTAEKRDADVGNSTHYWNPDIISSPGWGKDMVPVYTNPGVHIYGVMNDGSKYDLCANGRK